MQKPKYSIVIPTCDRANLLEYTIKGCLLQNYDNYELLVSDNYSNDNTKVILDSFKKDPKIRVVETKSRLAMPNHWEFAMSHALGEYIIILGDDDGISPDLLSILDNIIDQNDANIIKWESYCYHHPDWPGPEANNLRVDKKCSYKVHNILPEIIIKDYANFKFKYFPNLLQTCFSYDLYKLAKSKAGRVFVGAPDYSCPVLMLMDSKAKYTHIDAVLGFGGRSKYSNAAYLSSKDETRDKRIKEFLKEFKNDDPFPHHQPKIWAYSNILMASLSYARNYYPKFISDDSINLIELCKRIQNEIGSFKGTGEIRIINKNQLVSFYQFVESLSAQQKQIIKSMPGYPSFNGKYNLIVERIKNKGKNIQKRFFQLFPEFIKSIIKKAFRQSKPPNLIYWYDVTKHGCFNGEDVVSKLDYLVESGVKEYYSNLGTNNYKTNGLERIGKIKKNSHGVLAFVPNKESLT